ncbi:ABC transporter substrate-binding protein [Desulfallas thermosapovorans]|uniref:Putative ABC transport system substrate-binding protein n=1 Tax=Desulfallas thermosapovorans DSM 6562 TaxID=1121431 RepID=A0A5S4ZQB9_9FIRM|nr:ABC transporter substrate-binding protein [Desulfallas thermosapovorans]TYO94953.1 putative ABC transport system substrate-binding protein [Desulfallas thermosapovorans DSM 6562]
MFTNIFNKNIIYILVSLLLLLAATGCGGNEQAGVNDSDTDRVYRIGVTQFVDHPALNLDQQGFLDQMKLEGYIEGENILYDIQNSQGDHNLAKTIADKFVADKVDAIFAITTPSSQAAAMATKGTDIPVVFIAVSDAVGSGLIQANDKATGTNITGVYSADPVEQQMDLIGEFIPDIKQLGFIYNAGEANSVSNINRAKEYVESKGWNVVEVSVASSNEVQAAAQSLAGRVDAVFVPQDNTVISALEALLKELQDKNVPLFTGDTESVRRGAVATVGNDEYDCGAQGATMLARILKGEKAGEIVPEEIRKRTLMINKTAAQNINLAIPQSVLDRADEIVE